MRQILDRLWQLGIPHVTIVVGPRPGRGGADPSGRAGGRPGDDHRRARPRQRPGPWLAHRRHGRRRARSPRRLLSFAIATTYTTRWPAPAIGRRRSGRWPPHGSTRSAPWPRSPWSGPRWRPSTRRWNRWLGTGCNNVSVFAIATTDAAEASAGALLAHELPPAARRGRGTGRTAGPAAACGIPPCGSIAARPLGRAGRAAGPRCSGDTAIRVEPDGSVIPARGPFRAGRQPDRTTIGRPSNRAKCIRSYRRRVESDTHCDRCPGLAICAADCPRESGRLGGGGVTVEVNVAENSGS